VVRSFKDASGAWRRGADSDLGAWLRLYSPPLSLTPEIVIPSANLRISKVSFQMSEQRKVPDA